MKFNSKLFTIVVFLVTAFNSCTKKLDLFPTNEVTAESVFRTPQGYRQALAKVYASMAVTGTNGRDIPAEIVSDEGNTGFLRQMWYLQCLTTDEAGWTYSGNTDPIGIHQLSWSPSTLAVAGAYYRSYYVITICNNFITESSDDKLSQRGISGTDADNIRKYRAEARFLRAYNYWVLMDMFGNIPFIDDSYVIGSSVLPSQKSRSEIFTYVESELQSMEGDLVAPKANEYGRVDRAASWALLARMYLNAKTYTGTERNTDAIKYSNRVITQGGYSLHPSYRELMLADNHLNTDEFIWTIVFDGTHIQSYSGTTFLVHGPASNDQTALFQDTMGCSGSWNCIRMTEQFVDKFAAQDIRGQF